MDNNNNQTRTDYRDALCKNAWSELSAFKEEFLKLDKEEVFAGAFMINAKQEICYYLCDCAGFLLDDNEVRLLAELGTEVIDTLYDYFLDANGASVMYYSDIAKWVRDFCKKEMANRDEV